MLISLAFGTVLAVGPSGGPAVGTPKAAALPARPRPRAPHWVRPPSPVTPAALIHSRFSRRPGVSRVERGATSPGARLAVAPHVAWTVLAGAREHVAPSRHADATFERGPPLRA